MKPNHTNTLRSHRLKATDARKSVLDILSQTQQPLDVETIKLSLDRQNIQADQATIYRILKMFVDHDIVRKITLQEGKIHYELSDRPHHHHIICLRCGQIKDIEDCGIESVEKSVEKNTGFSVKSHSFELFGLCKNCKK